MDSPLFHCIGLAIIGYVFWMWLEDYRTNSQRVRDQSAGHREAGSAESPAALDAEQLAGQLPGATPVASKAVTIGIVGALFILAMEVAGEYGIDVVEEQKEMSILFGLYTLAAAFVEELIFRGYLYYDKGSRFAFLASVAGISILFAMLHPYIWNTDFPSGTPPWQFWKIKLSLDLEPKAILSTSILLLNSIWFYYVRFCTWNPHRSLIPCIAAHFASNLGVFVIKAAQGKISGLF